MERWWDLGATAAGVRVEWGAGFLVQCCNCNIFISWSTSFCCYSTRGWSRNIGFLRYKHRSGLYER